MTIPAGTYRIGPDNASLRIRTAREGLAAAVGHDLLLEFASWSGQLELTDPESAKVHVQVEVEALRVLEGTGGVAPLSEADKADITKNALRTLNAGSHPHVRFRGTATAEGVSGDLEVAGSSAPLQLAVEQPGPGRWRATGVITQSTWGIKPYRAMLGALRLADAVTVEAEIRLEGS